jgi:hypothetical protein
MWRGKKHTHGTLRSKQLDPAITRFGTSVQLTKKACDAVTRWYKQGALEKRVTDLEDRIETDIKRQRRV